MHLLVTDALNYKTFVGQSCKKVDFITKALLQKRSTFIHDSLILERDTLFTEAVNEPVFLPRINLSACI